MKLSIYGKSETSPQPIIVKTYEADAYHLMLGICEDVAAAVNLDDLETGSDVEIIKTVGKLIATSMGTVKKILKDVFPGITDDELRNTRVIDIGAVLVDVVKYTVSQIMLSLNLSKK